MPCASVETFQNKILVSGFPFLKLTLFFLKIFNEIFSKNEVNNVPIE